MMATDFSMNNTDPDPKSPSSKVVLSTLDQEICELKTEIQGTRWLVGAVNLDEDLHFSTYYLRASARVNLPKGLQRFGYSKIIAIFHDLNERYYLSQDECSVVAHELIAEMLANPEWFQQEILDEIYRRADALTTVFPESLLEQSFSDLTDSQIRDLYITHHTAHTHLYEVARIPETLDRGNAYFSIYLREYLRNRLPEDAGAKKLSEVFDALTYPEEQSKLVDEIEDLLKLAHEIRDKYGENVLAGTSKRMLMFLDPALVGKLRQHRDKWSFWGYHGYGSKATYDLDHYLKRIQDRLQAHGQAFNPTSYRASLREIEEKRIRLFAQLKIDTSHQCLFRFYARIGNAKLYRRYVQLRNFYFLDQILVELARRMNLSEAAVRSLLPEEIMRFGSGNATCQSHELRDRVEFTVLIIGDEQDKILSGSNWKWIEHELEEKLTTSLQTPTKLSGIVLCQGMARGHCKVINRREDIERVGFKSGDILVSQAADPELADCIANAAGVLVEAGGVTCHAAIVCRELGKPAISNIPGLLQLLKNDDYVFIDAYTGSVQVRSFDNFNFLRHSSQIGDAEKRLFGSKACTLAYLQKNGVNIPAFFAVPVTSLNFLNQPADASGTARDSLAREIGAAIDTFSSTLIILRSSGVDEDEGKQVTAGQYFSEAFVDRNDVVATVFRLFERMSNELIELSGALIIQEMILGDYSGVCFTMDPVNHVPHHMLIEAVPGGNELLTSGGVTPAMYTFQRQTRVASEGANRSPWQNVVDGNGIRYVASVAEKVESLLGYPQDIEWTMKAGELWVVQSRKISDSTLTFSQRKKSPTLEGGLRDIAILCRAYRVPPNLKMHLLRVAAVGAWICRHWQGPAVDEAIVVKTLLLHDIGNIVKADYITNPGLFPEEMQNLKYWIAVQDIVRERFGENDVTATLAIAKDIGVSSRVLSLIEQKQFVLNEETASSSDWERKICAYSDQRVTPHGVASLHERLEEARHRYQNVRGASVNSPHFGSLRECASLLERQIFAHLNSQPEAICDKVVQPIIEHLRNAKMF